MYESTRKVLGSVYSRAQGIVMLIARAPGKETTWTTIALVLITLASIAVSMQGWRARGLLRHEKDLVTLEWSAAELLHTGRVPDRGAVSSTLAFTPPGTSWLLVPGVMLFKDPRLHQLPMSAITFLLTLLGLLRLGRLLGGRFVGWLAIGLYAVSWIGLFFATSLWPRGHPVFVVWVVYFCTLAVCRSKSGFLVAATVLYAVGNYVFPELLPLVVAIAITVVLKRQLLTWRAAALTAAFILMVWGPYLRFQASRGFRDVAVLAGNRPASVSAPPWWPSGLSVRRHGSNQPVDPPALQIAWPLPQQFTSASQRFISFTLPSVLTAPFWNATPGFYDTPYFGTSSVTGSFLIGLLVWGTLLQGALAARFRGPQVYRIGVVVIAGVVLVWIGTNAVRSMLHPLVTAQGQVALVGVIRLYGLMLASLLAGLLVAGRRVARASVGWSVPPPDEWSRTAALIVASTFLLGQAFWTATAASEARRFMWLWPLQCLVISYAGLWLTDGAGRRILRPLVTAVALISSANNSVMPSRLASWWRHSWQGEDANVVKALDALAAHAKTRLGTASVAVSYDIVVDPAWFKMGLVDPSYDNAMAYDLYLQRKHGLRNRVTGVATFDSASDYLIREDPERLRTYNLYFERPVDLSRSYQHLMTSGSVRLYARPELAVHADNDGSSQAKRVPGIRAGVKVPAPGGTVP